MNLNPIAVVMFIAGVVLMYSAVKNRDPRDVVLTALGQKARFGEISNAGEAVGAAAAEGAKKGANALPSSGMGPKPGTVWV